MSTDPEKMLYEETPEAPVDVTPEVDVEDFDFEAFLSGVRATRRAVKVYARADLVAQMEEVAGGYRENMPAAAKKKILAEVTRLRDEFEASGRWFVAEARSSEWVEKFREDATQRAGDTGALDAEQDDLTPEQVKARQQVTLMQTAAQIVSPSGVTVDGLERLGQIAPAELNKVIAAVTFANRQSAGSAQVLTRDFSQGRSAKTPPQRGTSSRN